MQYERHERRFQVFISSTFRDLEQERAKVLEAILETKCFPTGMELFPSADEEQWQFIRSEIASSDYYLVIVAGKYGSVDSDGVSFTEREYDFAAEQKKPIMAFVYKDVNALTAGNVERSPERLEKLERFREKVSRSRLVKFYTNADELKAQVWHALHHVTTYNPKVGWVRADHATRMEDLEMITKLQRRVVELEAENRQLREHTVGISFSDGDISFSVHQPSFMEKELSYSSTWARLLFDLFEDGPRQVEDSLAAYLVEEFLKQHPVDKDDSGTTVWGRVEDLRKYFKDVILGRIRRKFLGHGLVEIGTRTYTNRNGPYELPEWRLTQTGSNLLLKFEESWKGT